jgi:hypothetical protein
LILLQEEWQPEKLSEVLHLYFDTFHLSNRHGSGVEVAKALANILKRLEEIELTIEKSRPHQLSIGQSFIVNSIGYGTISQLTTYLNKLRDYEKMDVSEWILVVKSKHNPKSRMS